MPHRRYKVNVYDRNAHVITRNSTSSNLGSRCGGTTAEAFIHACQAGAVNAIVTDVIYNNPIKPDDRLNHIVSRVQRLNEQYGSQGMHPGLETRTHLINNTTHPGGIVHPSMISDESSEAICEIFDTTRARLGLLLGFRKMIRGALLTRYANRGLLLNNHPGRIDVPELCGIWGNAVHQRAYELARDGTIDHTGFTIHFVDPEYDRGAVLEMVPVPIHPNDTPADVANNVRAIEKIHTPRIVDEYLQQLARA